MPEVASSRSWLGTALIAGSAVTYSTAGYFTRLIQLDIPTLLFWRGIYAGLFMSACIVVMYRGKTIASIRDIGWLGLLVAVLSALATVCYLTALRLTTVAEVMAINATSPFISGLLAWLIVGEKEHWKVVMVGPGAFGGHIAGAALALAMTLSLALMIVIMRAKKSISMLPASCLSAFLSALAAWPISSAAIPDGRAMFELALFGIVQFGLGLILL